jgi:hypothetical protein
VRRKFIEAESVSPAACTEVLNLIGRLYDGWNGFKSPTSRPLSTNAIHGNRSFIGAAAWPS